MTVKRNVELMSLSFGYNYDNNGNILSLTDSTLGETTTYTYDGLNRLKSAWDVHDSQDIYRQTFNYDKIGKLLQVSTLGNVAQQPIQVSHKVMAALIPLDFDISQSLSRGDSIGLFDDPPTETPTETPTSTNTSSPTETVTATYTPTDTPTLTHTASSTATYTPTATRTPTPTRTASVPTNTSQPTVTPSYTPTLTPYTTGVGLTGEYYDNDNLTWLKVVRTDACAGYLTHPSVFWGFKQTFLPIFTGSQTFSIHWDALNGSF